MLTQKNATARGSGNNFSRQHARLKKIALRQPLPRAVAFSLVCQVTLDNTCCGFLFAATTRGFVFTASSMSLHLERKTPLLSGVPQTNLMALCCVLQERLEKAHSWALSKSRIYEHWKGFVYSFFIYSFVAFWN